MCKIKQLLHLKWVLVVCLDPFVTMRCVVCCVGNHGDNEDEI
jgi:hypothetical protein